MATIVPGYVPVDGTPFDVAGWNATAWSLTNGVSLYGELNGHVQDANFAAGEKVYPRHIRPFEGFRETFDGAQETVDYHQFLFGESASEADWIPVAGASTRLYLGYAPFATLFRASCFVTNFRMRKGPASGQSLVVDGPEEYISLFIDGVRIPCTLRRLPITHWPEVNPGDAKWLMGRENVLSHHFDFTVFRGAIGAGWHDVDIRVIVLQNLGLENLYALYENTTALPTLVPSQHNVTHRIRGGIRSASIIGLS